MHLRFLDSSLVPLATKLALPQQHLRGLPNDELLSWGELFFTASMILNAQASISKDFILYLASKYRRAFSLFERIRRTSEPPNLPNHYDITQMSGACSHHST